MRHATALPAKATVDDFEATESLKARSAEIELQQPVIVLSYACAVELIKPIGNFYEPDPRMDASSGLTLDSLYCDAANKLELHIGVPEDVRSYFNAVVTLWLYGYLYYPFFAPAQTMGFTAMEMALKRRFPEMAKRTLRPLLEHAVARGILIDDGYPSVGLAWQNAEALFPSVDAISYEAGALSADSYADLLARTIPH